MLQLSYIVLTKPVSLQTELSLRQGTTNVPFFGFLCHLKCDIKFLYNKLEYQFMRNTTMKCKIVGIMPILQDIIQVKHRHRGGEGLGNLTPQIDALILSEQHEVYIKISIILSRFHLYDIGQLVFRNYMSNTIAL